MRCPTKSRQAAAAPAATAGARAAGSRCRRGAGQGLAHRSRASTPGALRSGRSGSHARGPGARTTHACPRYAQGQGSARSSVCTACTSSPTPTRKGWASSRNGSTRVVFDGTRAVGRRMPTPGLSVSVDAWEPYLEPADVNPLVHAACPAARRRRRPGFSRTLGGTGLRDGGGTARSAGCSPGPNGPTRLPRRSPQRRRPAMRILATPTTTIGWALSRPW